MVLYVKYSTYIMWLILIYSVSIRLQIVSVNYKMSLKLKTLWYLTTEIN